MCRVWWGRTLNSSFLRAAPFCVHPRSSSSVSERAPSLRGTETDHTVLLVLEDSLLVGEFGGGFPAPGTHMLI